MEKPITLTVTSAQTRDEIRDTITAGDSDAYPLSITFSDLTAITGTVRFRFVRGDAYWDRDATVAANVASLMLEPAFYAAPGTELWVSFEDSNLYTPLHVYFRDIRVPGGNVEAATSQTYPSWVAEVAEAEADRVTAEANRAVWEAFDPDKVYAVGEKAYHLGSSYIMHTVSGVAGTLPTDTDYWAIIAQKGDAGEMTIGTVTTLAPGEPATVTNSGTSTDAVLDIAVPAGYDGSAVPIDDASTAADRVLSASYIKGQLSAIDAQLAEITPEVNEMFKMVDVDVEESIAEMTTNRVMIETYTNLTDEIVHPSILFFPSKWRGYRYWMAYTCFDNGEAQYENPCIAVSNDNVNWTVPEGLVNPLEPTPAIGFYADPNLFMSADNKTMYLVYKYSSSGGIKTQIKSTVDGVNWTVATILFQNPYEDVSPSVIYDGNQYLMWTIKHADNPNTMWVRKSATPMGPWSEPIICATNWSAPTGMWHHDIRKVGNQYHILTIGAGGLFYFGKSNNGLDWNFASKPIFVAGRTSLDDTFYKATMFPMITHEGLKYGLWYGTSTPYYLFYSIISFDKSRRIATLNNKVLTACNSIEPWVFGDAFTRPDTSEGLGISATGQAWTSVLGNVMGVQNGKAYLPVATNSRSIVDIGISNFYVEYQITTRPTAGEAYLLFRYIDATNLFRVGQNGATFIFQKIVAGALSTITVPGLFIYENDRIGIECNGTTIKLYVNDKLKHTFTDSDNIAGTKIGLNIANVTTRIDNLIARKII